MLKQLSLSPKGREENKKIIGSSEEDKAGFTEVTQGPQRQIEVGQPHRMTIETLVLYQGPQTNSVSKTYHSPVR